MYVPRGKLLALITIVVAAALVTGSGAFSSATVERTASVEVTGDKSAYLGLQPVENGNGNFAEVGNDGKLSIDFTKKHKTSDGGKGVNPDSQYTFDDVFHIVNQGTQSVQVSVKDEHEDRLSFYDSEDGSPIDGKEIGTGEHVSVGVKIDASGLGTEDDFDDDFIIEAENSDAAKSVAGNMNESDASNDDSDE
ncbi:DUF1102 domain-containing protein [Halocatena halophila]|uniref:DUF1102 domain-containing protein n=1 Tax=Halocatena halophila TaxID=2814576 RepID=UPI002ED69932